MPRGRLFLVLSVSLTAACAKPAPPPQSFESPLLDDLIPSFESQTVSGNPLYSSEFRSHVMVVTVVAPNCKPCARSLSAVQEMYGDHHEVVAVGVFSEGVRSDASSLMSELKLKFPLVVDDDGVISRAFKIDDVPRTFVADSRGWVRWVGGPEMTAAELVAAVENADQMGE